MRGGLYDARAAPAVSGSIIVWREYSSQETELLALEMARVGMDIAISTRPGLTSHTWIAVSGHRGGCARAVNGSR